MKQLLVVAVATLMLFSCEKNKRDCYWQVQSSYYPEPTWLLYEAWEDHPKGEREAIFRDNGYCWSKCQPHSYCLDAEVRDR